MVAKQPRRAPETKEKSVVGLYLYFAVFLSGGSILVMEIAAGRVLAPHFGNTLYTWTSMIGIILAALSLGYSIGGRLADQKPSSKLFFLLMLGGAGLVALVPALRGILLPDDGRKPRPPLGAGVRRSFALRRSELRARHADAPSR